MLGRVRWECGQAGGGHGRCYSSWWCVLSPHREMLSAVRHMPSAPQVAGEHFGPSMAVGSDGGRYITASRDGYVCVWKCNLALTRTIQVRGGAWQWEGWAATPYWYISMSLASVLVVNPPPPLTPPPVPPLLVPASWSLCDRRPFGSLTLCRCPMSTSLWQLQLRMF